MTMCSNNRIKKDGINKGRQEILNRVIMKIKN